MNIFYLDKSPVISAQSMHDRHVVKMILETAQLLCTAHRILDGSLKETNINGKIRKKYIHPNLMMHNTLYQATHKNHPSAIWVRDSAQNYEWLYAHFLALMSEYSYRYNKRHKCEFLISPLSFFPNEIDVTEEFKEPPQCMPDDVKVEGDTVLAYRNYYNKYKWKTTRGQINKYTQRKRPEWLEWS